MTVSILDSPLLLPALTTLIGTGGLTVGLYSFLNPSAAARIYGIPVPITSSSANNRIPDLTSFLVSSGSSTKIKTKAKTQTQTQIPGTSTLPLTVLHSLAIRNLTTGLTILLLTAYYYKLTIALSNTDDLRNSLADNHSTAIAIATATKDSLRGTLGLIISIGSLVPFVDAWVCWGWVGAGIADRDSDGEDEGGRGDVGRRAGWVHFLRGLAWVGVGMWCCFGR